MWPWWVMIPSENFTDITLVSQDTVAHDDHDAPEVVHQRWQNIFLFIGEWEEELINTHTRALAFNFSLVPPSYSASSLVKRAGLVWCSKDLPYLKVAEILPVLTLWFDQYVLMEGERGWGSYFSVHIILCISLILDQDEHFDDRQCVHFKWTWTGICDKNVSNMQTHKSQPT